MCRKPVVLAIATICAATPSVQAQTSSVEASNAPAQLGRVEITGSSIKRIDAEAALPVTLLNREDIKRSGVNSTEELLNTLSVTGTAGASSLTQSGGQITYGVSTISLRGLGSNRTLVLVNGRRLATFAAGPGADSGSVDVSAIPLSAIDRVEILRDGASGVYGSDAIAGVVNFILRKDYAGFELSAGAGIPTRGDAKNYRAGVLWGLGSDEGKAYNVMFSANVERTEGLLGQQRNFSRTSYNPPIFDGSYLSSGTVEGAWVPGVPTAEQAVTPIGGIGGPNAPGNCAKQGNFYNPSVNDCWYDFARWAQLIPDQTRANFIGSGRIAITPEHEAYGEVMLARTKTKTYDSPFVYTSQFLSGDKTFQQIGAEPTLLIYPGNPNYPSAWLQADPDRASLDGQPLSVTYRLNQVTPRRRENIADQQRVVAGARGLVAGWDYDVGLLANRSKVTENTLQGFQLQAGFVNDINNPASTWNPFGAPDATVLAGLANWNYAGRVVTSTSKSTGIDAKASRDLTTLGGGPLSVALGFASRRDSYEQDPSEAGRSGDISGYGQAMQPLSVSRSVNAVFGELAAPFTRQLELNLAVRYDHYSDVGGSLSPKASLRWQPSRSVLLRSSVGRGFRAPSFSESSLPPQFQSTAFVEDPLTGVTSSWIGTTGGNPNLEPEKSTQRSLGVVVSPLESLTVGVDAFAVRVNGAIATPPVALILQKEAAGDPYYSGLVSRSASGEITNINVFPLNLNKIEVQGIDVDIHWRQSTEYGKFGVALVGTYISKYDVTRADGTVQNSVGRIVDDDNVPLVAVGSGGVILRWRHALTLSYGRGPWGLALTQHYFGGYKDAADLEGNPRTIRSFSSYDLNVGYRGIKNLEINAGARNLFDRNPPVFVGFFQYIGSGYDPSNYDARGRTVYLNAIYKFR